MYSSTRSSQQNIYIFYSIYIYIYIYIYFYPVALRPNVGHGLLIPEISRSHTTTYHTWQDSSGRVISSSQRPLPDNTQHSQQTSIPPSGGIRTHNIRRRAAADLRLRSRGHLDRQHFTVLVIIYRRFGTTYRSHLKGSRILTLEGGTRQFVPKRR